MYRAYNPPDDEISSPLRILVENLVHFIQHLAEFRELEGLLDLGQHIRLWVVILRSEKNRTPRMSNESNSNHLLTDGWKGNYDLWWFLVGLEDD